MDAQESKQKFQQADQLFRDGRYQEALGLLDELNRAYPNAKNVLYPAAMCLRKLGRANEALPICDQLIGQFQDPRAEKLKARILAEQQSGGTDEFQSTALADLGLTGASDILDDGPPRQTPAYSPVDEGPNWLKYTLIGLGVAVVLTMLIVPPLMYEAPPEPPPGSTAQDQQQPGFDPEAFGNAIGIGAFLVTLVCSFAGYVVGGYVALRLMNQLPSGDLGGDLLSVALTAVVVTLVGFIPLVGWIIGLVIISKNFDLGCGGLLIFVILAGVCSFICAMIPLFMMVGSLAALTAAPV